jgi:glycosyltransferase involved in cell wall biosynthesis
MLPIVSSIICTRNRGTSLEETLASIGRCEVPVGLPTELLIIDNGSTDNTREICERTELTNMPVRYVLESRPGKGYAYNKGIAASCGQILLFTDDDVRVPNNWVERMCRPILQGEADAVAGGVSIAPALERPWLKGFMRTLVACTDSRTDAHDILLVGANMAFSRHLLETVPAFDPELGPGALGFGEETLFSMQMIKAGFRLVGRLETTVEHHFDEERLTRETFLGIAERSGRTNAYLQYHWEHLDLATPYLYELWIGAKLKLRRVLSCTSGRRAEPMPWEIVYTRELHFCRQFQREIRRPRNYEKFGLVKLRGVLSHANPGSNQ